MKCWNKQVLKNQFILFQQFVVLLNHDNSELTKKLEIDTIDATTLINELIIKDNPKLLTIDSDNDESVDDDFELSEEDI